MKIGMAVAALFGVILAGGASTARNGGEGLQSAELVSVRDIDDGLSATTNVFECQVYDGNWLRISACSPRMSIGNAELEPFVHLVRSEASTECPSADGIYPISQDKINVIGRINRRICQVAMNNDFYGIEEILKKAGEHIGKEITLEEAYPYIDCGKADLLRRVSREPRRAMHVVFNLIDYLSEKTCDRTFLQKIVSCEKDYGGPCLSLLDYLRMNIRWYDGSIVEDYKHLLRVLNIKIEKMGGVVRDVGFCREVMSEPYYCDLE